MTGNIPAARRIAMSPDDEICLCFHVTRRKVLNFIRVEHVRRVGQLAECFGAGTGCGWCRPFLEQMFDEACGQTAAEAEELTPERYAAGRQQHIAAGKGRPPS